MTPPLRAVQSVEDFLAHPERVKTMDPTEAQRLAVQLAALLLSLTLRASESVRLPSVPDPVTWVSAEQAERRFGLSANWLHEHRRQLASLGIVSRVSRKTILYDVKKLSRFVESRRVTNDHVAS